MLNTPDVAAFLSRIIPKGGRYVGFHKLHTKGGGNNISADTAEDLVEKLFKENAKGREAYFAPASFDEGGNRKAVNALSLSALFFDLDAHGDGKGYDSPEEAAQAAVDACLELDLGKPVVIDTGGGAQAFILLKRALPRGDWTRLAKALKAALIHIGVKLDPSRTADAASVMRLPGSINHRWGRQARLLMDLSGFKRLDVAEVEKKLSKYGSQVALATTNGKPTRIKPARYARRNKDAELIVSKCAQIAQFRETGSPEEPHWHSACSILATCMDGEELFHAWSSVDPRYDPPEAQAKFAAAVASDKPHTCAQFNNHNDLCQACAYLGKIKCPAELGMLRQEDLPQEPPPVDVDGNALGYKAFLPEGYAVEGEMLVFLTADKDGAPVSEIVCDRPVWFETAARREESNDNYIVMKHYSFYDKVVLSDTFPVGELLGRNGMAALQNVGPVVRNAELMLNFVQLSRMKLNRETAMMELYGSFGWKKEGFLLGPLLYEFANKGKPRIAALLPGSFAANYAAQLTPGGGQRLGSLEGWKNSVRFCTQPGFEFQLDALVTSFASPTLALVAKEEGGEARNYCSTSGGTGKTTASVLGQSVWGAPKALQIAAGTSEITRAGIWAGAGHLPTFEDESIRLDAVQVRNRLMAFTNGRKKSTSDRGSNVKANASAHSSFYVVTSNESFLAALSQGEGSDAMRTRIFETQVAALPCKSDPKLLTKLAANPGWAGPIFIKALVSNPDLMKDELAKRLDKYAALLPGPEYRYKAQSMACVDLTVEILIGLKLLEAFDVQRYLNWRLEEMQTDQQYTSKASKEDVLRLFFDDARDKTLTVAHGVLNGKVAVSIAPGSNAPRGEIAIRAETKHNRCFISRRSLNAFLSKHSVPPKEFYQWATAKGIMPEADTTRDLTSGVATLNKGMEHVCIIDLSRWKLDDV